MNDTKLGNKSVTFAAHTTIYEKRVSHTRGGRNRNEACFVRLIKGLHLKLQIELQQTKLKLRCA